MSPYLDVAVIPVPRAKLDAYKQVSAEWGKAHLRLGALYYSDAVGDDVQPGKLTSFPQAVQLGDDEVVAVSWVVYKSKDDRDRIAKAVMDDAERLQSAVARSRDESDFMPDASDLPEFMPEGEFVARFGGVGGPAYQRMVAEIDARVGALPLFR